jgi:glutamyl-tRNA synthetase
LLYEAFGWTSPTFAHLPLILRPDGKGKLSKRDGEIGGFPVYPLGWKEIPGFKESGFLSAPLLNFLALLGWSTKSDDEVLSLQQMSALFSMQGIQKAGARFDIEKLRWFNQQYLQGLPDDSLAEHCLAFSPELKLQSVERIIGALSLAKERLVVPQDLYNEHRYFFAAPKEYDQTAASKQWKEDSSKLLNEFLRQCEKTAYTQEELEACLTTFSETSGIGVGKVMAPLRLALVGALKGPSVYALMHYLGKDEVVKRVAKASSTL